jgi:hypothetical protein
MKKTQRLQTLVAIVCSFAILATTPGFALNEGSAYQNPAPADQFWCGSHVATELEIKKGCGAVPLVEPTKTVPVAPEPAAQRPTDPQPLTTASVSPAPRNDTAESGSAATAVQPQPHAEPAWTTPTADKPVHTRHNWAQRHVLLLGGLGMVGVGMALVETGGPGGPSAYCIPSQNLCGYNAQTYLGTQRFVGVIIGGVGVPIAILGALHHSEE